jgi:hypothetical protein
MMNSIIQTMFANPLFTDINLVLCDLGKKLNKFQKNLTSFKTIFILIAVCFATVRITYYVLVGGKDKRSIFMEIIAMIGVILLVYLSDDIVYYLAKVTK